MTDTSLLPRIVSMMKMNACAISRSIPWHRYGLPQGQLDTGTGLGEPSRSTPKLVSSNIIQFAYHQIRVNFVQMFWWFPHLDSYPRDTLPSRTGTWFWVLTIGVHHFFLIPDSLPLQRTNWNVRLNPVCLFSERGVQRNVGRLVGLFWRGYMFVDAWDIMGPKHTHTQVNQPFVDTTNLGNTHSRHYLAIYAVDGKPIASAGVWAKRSASNVTSLNVSYCQETVLLTNLGVICKLLLSQ